jgi:single-strand DNA-binding protein
MDVNKVTLIGNIVRDPRERRLSSGQNIASFDLATNYTWRDIKTHEKKESTEYHAISAWGKLAEIIQTYVKKGSKIYVSGRLHKHSWKDASGRAISRTEIIADEVVMLGHRSIKKDPTELPKDELSVEEIPVNA